MAYDQEITQPLKMGIVRTNPEQGKPVVAYVYVEPQSNDPYGEQEAPAGRLEVDYAHWLQFEKLLRDGMERRQREGNTRLVITLKTMEVSVKEADGTETKTSTRIDHSILLNALKGEGGEGEPDKENKSV